MVPKSTFVSPESASDYNALNGINTVSEFNRLNNLIYPNDNRSLTSNIIKINRKIILDQIINSYDNNYLLNLFKDNQFFLITIMIKTQITQIQDLKTENLIYKEWSFWKDMV